MRTNGRGVLPSAAVAVSAAIGGSALLAPTADAANFGVTSLADSGPDSLRAAAERPDALLDHRGVAVKDRDGSLAQRFPHAPKHLLKDALGDFSDEQFGDWKWQQRNRFRRIDELEKLITLSDGEREAFAKSDEMFHMGITPYYASLMDRDDPACPIRLQSVPQLGELTLLDSDLEDPLGEEKDMPVPGITHRYPDRVLFYTTHNCPVYCRHCTRKRKVSDPTSAADKDQIELSFAYIEKHPEVRDIVISGGDPLSLSDDRLDYILGRLRSIPHVEMFRMGTRNLVTLPQRVTDQVGLPVDPWAGPRGRPPAAKVADVLARHRSGRRRQNGGSSGGPVPCACGPTGSPDGGTVTRGPVAGGSEAGRSHPGGSLLRASGGSSTGNNRSW